MNDNKMLLSFESEYVRMSDGTRLAVSYWRSCNEINSTAKNSVKCPAVLITTRYWRATAFAEDKPEFQLFYPLATTFAAQGYLLVVADARGSGASFGHRESEISPIEVEDIGELIDWVAQQPWCDGRVATTGTSYTAATTLYSLVTAPGPLKLGVCRAPDFDAYRHLLAPGGVINRWFIGNWGELTGAQDRNDVTALIARGYRLPTTAEGIQWLGVRPVDADSQGELLAAAVAEHQQNFNLAGSEEGLQFVGTAIFGSYRYLFEPEYKTPVERSGIPLVIRCGWHDAGTQLGALAMFASFNCPMRVILGPWSHAGDSIADPFSLAAEHGVEAIPMDKLRAMTIDSLNVVFKPDNITLGACKDTSYFGVVEYYTLGENCWKTTTQWPLPHTQMQRFYCAANQQLTINPPDLAEGCDHYQVDPNAGTGANNRWFAQMGGNPILFPDRQEADKKLLVYDTPPLENDIEITGHPIVSLQIRSTATDGLFFVYLETVDPDGRVRLLTEGQLRGLHRKISAEPPPYKMFGPYHSLKPKDAWPLIPGEVAEITFDLFPISVRLKKGQRIRVAIAGADKDVFASVAGCESPDIILERNRGYSSYIDLPMVAIESNAE